MNATEFYTATADLNVRTGGGTKYSVAFTLQRGDEVEILDKNSDWYQIKYFEKTGYAHSKYLNYSRNISDTTDSNFNLHVQSNIFIELIICVVILGLGLILFRNQQANKLLESATKNNRGTRTERDLVYKLLKSGIPADKIFHDLYLKKSNGNYTQIDLVVVTNVGLIVFEVKNYKGWIFGTGYKPQWVQVLAYGKTKYRFYNPILQNTKHVQDLRKLLTEDKIPIFSVVVFFGDCVLKEINFVPKGTFVVKSERISEAINTIINQNDPAHYNNPTEVVRVLSEAVENGENWETQTKHVENINDMLGKDRIFQ
ncbi:MAG: NERD domain-containing protein [Ferruginibacter sp.]